jgi:TonB family protein
MRMHLCLVILALNALACAKDKHSTLELPDHFVIARHTFFDFGPPSDFYDIFVVRAEGSGTRVENLSITPPGAPCIQPAKVEVRSVVIEQSTAKLMSGKNACAIPEKELRKERKRCKKCLVFSGANVVMRLQCGNQTRDVRADILDKDWFDRAPGTPEHTSWTMRLLALLQEGVGPGPMDKPMFDVGDPTGSSPSEPSSVVDALARGEYDDLLPSAAHRLSDLYRQAQVPPSTPSVRILSATPYEPATLITPKYPPIARLAKIEGRVVVKAEVAENGTVSSVVSEGGHPMLKPTAIETVKTWTFPPAEGSRTELVEFEFVTNCIARAD